MLIDAMKKQFNAAFSVLEAAIGSFTPEQWRSGSKPFNGPGRAALHALLAADFYATEDRSVRTRFGKPVAEMDEADLPAQEQALQYLPDVRTRTMAWIDAIGDAGFAAPWKDASSINGLDRVAYALRHLQHHTGEVCAYQKQVGLEPAPWK
jgi:hypothetical protein